MAGHVSGREVRQALYAQTLYEFELTFDGLDSGPANRGLGAQSLQSLIGLYLQCQGQFGSFLYTDPSDCAATAQGLGTGDGATTTFTFQRSLGGALEPVAWVSQIGNIFINGTAQPPSAWTANYPNQLVFNSAPAAGATITADFTYAFVCRFLDDQEDFEEFMSGLWQVQSLKFRSVKGEATASGTIPFQPDPPTFPIDFTRGIFPAGMFYSGGTNGTYVNSSGLIVAATGSARLDFTGGTGALLVEPASTNLLEYSAQLDQSYWTKTLTTITPDSIASPDGTVSADEVLDGTALGSHVVQDSIGIAIGATTPFTASGFLKAGTLNVSEITDNSTNSYHAIYTGTFAAITANTTYTYGALLKAGTETCAVLSVDNGSTINYYAVFDLANGVISKTGGVSGVTGSQQIIALGQGFYLCIITANLGSSVTSVRVSISMTNNVTSGGLAGPFSEYAGTGLNMYVGAILTSVPALTPIASGWNNGNVTQASATFINQYAGVTITGSNNGAQALFDLVNGVVTSSSPVGNGTVLGASLEPVGTNGWYRFSLSFEVSSAVSAALRLFPNPLNRAGAPTYSAFNNSFYAWGLQVEQTASASSYIPTAGAMATRSADVVTFTMPAGKTHLTYAFGDGTQQAIGGETSDTTYTIPNNLNESRIATIQVA